MKNNMVMTMVLAVIVGIAVFFGGMKYQEAKTAGINTAGQFQGAGVRGTGQNRQGGRFGGAGATAGEIISSDSKNITVKLTDGSSKIILLNDKTQINKSAAGTAVDLKTGTRVAVFGAANSDGSVTAQNIQLNPNFGGNGRMPNQSPKSADAREIVVTGSNYKFDPDKITVKKGEKTRIVFKNTDGMHDFRVDELNISTAVIRSGEEDFVEFTADKAGQYEFYCSVDGHRQMGMKGTLVVE